jgi:outer membrane protein, heavy metal efflux system
VPNCSHLYACICTASVLMAWQPCIAQHPHADRAHAEALPSGVDAASPTAPRDGLPLDVFEYLALGNNPTLFQADAHVTMARGRRIQSGLLPNPNVGYVGEEIGDEGRAGQQGAFIEQAIPTGGKLRLNRQTFAHEENQERWAFQAQQLSVLNAVRISFYETLAAQQLVEVRGKLARVADDGVRVTQELMNVGQADRPDYLAMRMESRKASVALSEAQNRHHRLWAHLTAVAGAPELELQALDGELEKTASELDRDAALARILWESLELRIARAGVDRARAALARARVEPVPNVFMGASVLHDFATTNNIAGVRFGINLPVFDRNQGNILSEEGALQHACREVERIELSLRSRFAEAFERYATAQRTVNEYQSAILPDARQSYELYVQAFERRAAAFPQVLISQRSYFEAQSDYLVALSDLRVAEVELDGLLLIDGLSQPEPHGSIAPEPPGLPVRSGR